MPILLSLLLLLFSPRPAAAMDAAELDAQLISTIEGVRVRQIGGDCVIIELRGSALCSPVFIFGDDCAASFEWRQTDLAAGLKRGSRRGDGWELLYDYPLARRLNFLLASGGGLSMRLSGDKPLRLVGVGGMENSDALILRLETLPKIVTPAIILPEEETDGLLGRREKVTMELRGVSPAAALRMAASLAGMNLIADQSVPDGVISVSFRDAPLGEVFGWLLRINGLVHRVSGNTLFVGTEQSVAEAVGDLDTRAYRIAYGDITQAASIVTTLVAGLATSAVDEKNRVLYITGTAAQHRLIGELLKQIDAPGRQVMLEARLIEVNKSAKEEIEAMISAIYRGWLFSYGAAGSSLEYGYANKIVKGATADNPLARVADPAIKLLDVGLRAMESEQKGKVLASPSIVALDGRKAVIKLTRNYLYQSSVDDKGNAKFSEQETGPSLEITPLIGRDGFMTMNLRISSGEIIGFHKSGASEAPETSKREVDTCVRVRDGEPFVIGGLYAESKNRSVARTPVLGYIPLLGELFTSRSETSVSSELAFIVVPHILDIPDGETSPQRSFGGAGSFEPSRK